MRFGLVADDLTGACDSSVPFLAAGRVRVSIWPDVPTLNGGCTAFSTESREARPDSSVQRSQVAAKALKEDGVDFLYRKVDSRLRGNVAADLAGTLMEWNAGCVLAPALPEEGRITVDGRQKWESGDVDVVKLLRDAGLRASIGQPGDARPGEVVVCNAATPDDLRNIAHKIQRASFPLVAAGSAGLATRLPEAFGYAMRFDPGWPKCLRPLAIVGSPAAAAQAKFAAERGRDVKVLRPGQLPTSLSGHDGIVVTGGDTASRILKWLGVTGLDLRGEVLPRFPVGVCQGGAYDGMPIALKSGGFGLIDAIDRALDGLNRGG